MGVGIYTPTYTGWPYKGYNTRWMSSAIWIWLTISCCTLFLSGIITKNCTLHKMQHHHILCMAWHPVPWTVDWPQGPTDLSCVLFLFEGLNQWESLILKTYHTGLTEKTNYRYSTWATVPLNFLRKNVEPASSRLQKCLQNFGVASKSDTKW